jgi:hypothetical protein
LYESNIIEEVPEPVSEAPTQIDPEEFQPKKIELVKKSYSRP